VNETPALPKPGDIVGGKYRVERKLGSGGMGAVFEVTHRVTSKRFAIKWLLPEVATEEDALKRFMREAQVAGRFEHPNVVEVYDIGQDGASFFMVMELLEGESLADRLGRLKQLTPQQACELLVPCMEGVAAAHAAGIVPRDLKPANMFVVAGRGREREHAKVLDFGISKLSTAPGIPDATLTRAGAVMGTPHYMAPEQMRAQPVDARADVYAFGVILYESLTGQRPFDAQTYADLVLQVLGESAKPLTAHVPALPEELSQAVLRAMARDPSERFDSLRDLVDALAPFYDHAALHPIANSGPEPSAHPRRTIEQTGEHPETPLFSESLYTSNSRSFQWHRLQLWLAGTFGAVLLIAFIAAIFSKPDTAALHPPAAALHEVKPMQTPASALEPEVPEPLPATVRLEPEVEAQPRVWLAPDGGTEAHAPAAVPELSQPAATATDLESPRQAPVPARVVEPTRPRRIRERTVRSTEPPTPGTVRPRVELDRDSF
jgi:serine/threonine-protein kinase